MQPRGGGLNYTHAINKRNSALLHYRESRHMVFFIVLVINMLKDCVLLHRLLLFIIPKSWRPVATANHNLISHFLAWCWPLVGVTASSANLRTFRINCHKGPVDNLVVVFCLSTVRPRQSCCILTTMILYLVNFLCVFGREWYGYIMPKNNRAFSHVGWFSARFMNWFCVDFLMLLPAAAMDYEWVDDDVCKQWWQQQVWSKCQSF